jgi:hypothetical protein
MEQVPFQTSRLNFIELTQDCYLLRTQAGYNKVLRMIKKRGCTHSLLYPASYPCVMKMSREYPGAKFYTLRFLKLETAIKEFEAARTKLTGKIDKINDIIVTIARN